jgi:predicted NodU family carbamoyl transferase
MSTIQEKKVYPSQAGGKSKWWKQIGAAFHIDEIARIDSVAQQEGISRYALLQRFVRVGLAEAEKKLSS